MYSLYNEINEKALPLEFRSYQFLSMSIKLMIICNYTLVLKNIYKNIDC